MLKLTSKIIIKGKLFCHTGLRIGGNKSSLEIGGVDLNIIKDARGVPYLPGSSLKGKLRSLLAKPNGWESIKMDGQIVTDLFGGSGGKDSKLITRLFVRDATLDVAKFNEDFPDKNKRDFEYSETKTENVINRSTGKAQHPRTIERVPAGAVFNFEMMLDIYENDNLKKFLETLTNAFELLEYDYLGGHGSRGSGKVKIYSLELKGKKWANNELTDMNLNEYTEMFKKFAEPINEKVQA